MRYFFIVAFLGFSAFYATVSIAQNEVDLYIPGQYAEFGEVIYVPVQVNGFTDIIAFQSSLNWNPALLRYIGVSDFGIKDLGIDDFGTSSTDVGHLRFAWDPNDAISVSAADSTVLFIAQFEVLATQNQDISIGFIDNTSAPAFPTEFANDDFTILPVSTFPGTITVLADLQDLVNISSDPNTSCDAKNPTGSLKADVNGDSLNYTFQWYIGNEIKTNPDYVGYRYSDLSAGDYTLQVLDEDGEVFVESMPASVADESNYQSDVITVISKNPQTSCSTLPDKQTGLLEIEVNSAQNPNEYFISWWYQQSELTDFSDSYSAANLQSGDYEIVVENKANGCVSYQIENILYDPVIMNLTLTSEPNNFCKDGANGSVNATVDNPNVVNASYFWFDESDMIDTTKALHKGATYDQLAQGAYKSWVIDLESECYGTGNVTVESDKTYTEAIIEQKGTTLVANSESAQWFIIKGSDKIYLQETGAVYSPETSGYFFARIKNEFNCQSDSENLYYGITGFEASENELLIYPNPFNEYVRISNNDGLLEFVRVYDTKGSLISENNTVKDKFIDIPLTGSPGGIYLFYLQTGGKTIVRKVVKNMSK